MPPNADDKATIPNESNLIRVAIRDSWIQVDKNTGLLRPTSDSLLESNFEASFFVEGEVTVEEIQHLFPQKRLYLVTASILREVGFWLERRPDEAPEGLSRPEAHIVAGPPTEIQRNVYTRSCRNVVKNPAIRIVDASRA